jgi:hypothetical protein
MNKANADYFAFSSYGFRNFADRSLIEMRSKIVKNFVSSFVPDRDDTILDVGASAERHPSSNMLEKLYPHTNMITATGLGYHGELEKRFPGIKYVQTDGMNLPFMDGEFAFVHSHAVIEHVGSFMDQLAFVAELFRVANKGVFFTTPNRFHPLEFHTGIPIVHWLPHVVCSKILKALGHTFYSDRNNLNLLSRRSIEKLLNHLNIRNYEITGFCWLMFPSNFAVKIWK